METTDTDPFVAAFFSRIPAETARTFTDAQLDAVKMAFGARSWGSHAVDIRWSIPLISRRLYILFLAGQERRPLARLALERALRPFWTFANAVVITAFILMLLGAIFSGLYMGKRALGIDVFPGIDMLPDKEIERILGK